MATIEELNVQFQGVLKLVFENETRYRQYLLALEALGPVDVDEEMAITALLGQDQLVAAGAAAGVTLPTVNDIMKNWGAKGAEWGKAILAGFDSAGAQWPRWASEHSVVIGRTRQAF